MDPIDRQLLNEMQDRFPLVPEPFAELAARIGTDEADVIARLSALRASGVLRQVSAIFDTKTLGYQSSLVATRIPEERLAAAAAAVNAHPGVSHNYRRTHAFNMWFAIAVPPGSDLQAHIEVLHHLAQADSTRMLPATHLFKIGVTLDMTGERPIDDKRHELDDYAVLYSTAELKKVRLAYFTPGLDARERRHLSERQGRRASIWES